MADTTLPSRYGRRRFLGLAGAGFAGLALPLRAPAGATGTRTSAAGQAPRFRSYPFALGVASGDPVPDGVALWTRIAPDPVAPDGLGGVPRPHQPIPVRWEVATDGTFGARSLVRRGVATADPSLAHSVHVEVEGLGPDRVYWYRFLTGDEASPVGRTRTAPAPNARLSSMAFAFVSCQNYPAGHYTALRHLAEDDLDVVFHLGDYIYEGGATGSIGRAHLPTAETFTLADYRVRYGQYKADPDLQAAHASAPFVVVFDDHEVENNWAGAISQVDDEPDQDPVVFLQRRAAAFQAYYENMPLRRASMPNGPDMQAFRRIGYGQLAEFHVLDTRQYRSDQADENNTEVRWDPTRTLLGDEQEQWLIEGMAATPRTWNVIAQQSKVAETDDTVGPGESYPSDNWDGYAAARARLFKAVHERGVENMVIVSGDAHVSLAANLKPRFKDAESPVVGAEFLGTSVSSSGDGSEITERGRQRLAENPHILFYNQRRGYQRCIVTPDELRTDYLIVPYVTSPGAPIVTRATGYVEAGRPGVAQMEDGTII
ncbi:MAG TPA: alkaline phosphatase D family protein [Acidimicrobiales bacterium]|jgi:alkaline phosphatase D|nr:alkaline phosphatase D family protein [Acidimicrobiales bacterium]